MTISATIPRFHPLTIADLRREGRDAISLAFAVPPGLADAYQFTPGQYLTLRTMMDGEEVRRSYSICSGPDDGELRIAVKRVDGGAFSVWATEELHAGDTLEVMTPTGRFGAAHAAGDARTYVGFAAGSGITPMIKGLSIALVGGLGSIPGAVIGAIMLGVNESLTSTFLGGQYVLITQFLLIIVVLLIRPRGISGILDKAREA